MRWFKHDTNSNRDAKLEKVLMRYGAEGYALYWLCLELIAEPIDKHNLTFELEHDSEILANRLKMDSARVEEIMKYMTSLGLFEFDTATQRLTCLKLANRLENSIVKNRELKEIQQLMAQKSGVVPDNPGQSGKNPARREEKRSELTTLSGKPDPGPRKIAKQVLEFVNAKTGRNYRPVDANLRLIEARLKEYPEQTLRQVVAKKCREWGKDEKMSEYLRPKTLFNATNFANYAGEITDAC